MNNKQVWVISVINENEWDCHPRTNNPDRMRRKETITEINDDEICQKILLNLGKQEWVI
jgi:hypothetical protein